MAVLFNFQLLNGKIRRRVCKIFSSSLSYITVFTQSICPATILDKSTAGRYQPVSYPDGPITARYRFIYNAYWVGTLTPYHTCLKSSTGPFTLLACLQTTEQMTNSVDLYQTHVLRRLNWVYIVCSGLSVRIVKVNTVCLHMTSSIFKTLLLMGCLLTFTINKGNIFLAHHRKVSSSSS